MLLSSPSRPCRYFSLDDEASWDADDVPWAAERRDGGVYLEQRLEDDEASSDDSMRTPHHIICSIEDILASPSPQSPAHRQALNMLDAGVDMGVGLGITGLLTLPMSSRNRSPEVHCPVRRPVSMAASFVGEGSAFGGRRRSRDSVTGSTASSDDDHPVGGSDSEDDSCETSTGARYSPEEGILSLELSEYPLSSKGFLLAPPQRPVNPTGSRSSSPFGILWPAASGALEYASVPMRRYVGNGRVDAQGRRERVSRFVEAGMDRSEEEAEEEENDKRVA
ncbi:hypothetical protein B0A55_09359 [Friedmanniomyces simplex]|uniref:Uncharacterized protein n=1 Tax=Friedmanniomyces simplex TaxID=329884 RepID=A0A4U0WUU4_9PEZI|nr:hypothetical protein B0A55_09359 [Friedmanniomyces simplex]